MMFRIERWNLVVRIQPMIGQIDLSSMLSMYSGDSYPLHRKGLPSNIETLSSFSTFPRDKFSSLNFLNIPISRQLSLHDRHWPRLIIILLPTELSQQRRSTARLQLTPPLNTRSTNLPRDTLPIHKFRHLLPKTVT